MVTVSGTLTINAAFLQEIKEDNRELRQLLSSAQSLLSRPRPAQAEPKRLVEVLGKLRDQLAFHFALEEAFGYFDDAVSVAPQLTRRAEKLRGQHRDLFLNLCGIFDQAEQLLYHEQKPPALDEIVEAFMEFHTRFQEHEAQECELIVAECNEEIGCGD